MPKPTPTIKVMQTEGHGATIVLHGELFDEAYAHALKLAEEQKLTFVHPFDDPQIIAGQGTVALEMLEDPPEIDPLVVPLGGGGLISGAGISATPLKPYADLVSVPEPPSPSMYCIVSGGDITTAGDLH